MKNKKKQTIILITATTLGMSNVVNSYAFVHAQDIPQATAPQVNTKATNDIYNEHGDLLINETTFPDPYFRDYVNREFANGRGVLPQSEVNSITSISPTDDVGGKPRGLKSVEGIAYFPNLSVLNLSDTGLTTLDVSKNTELKELYVANTPLKVLELRYNKKLTAVDATGVQLAYFYWDKLENTGAYKNFKIDSNFHNTIYSLSSTVDLTKIYPGLDPSKMILDSGGTIQEGKLSNFKYDTPIKFIINIAIYEHGSTGQQQGYQRDINFTIKEGLAIDDINFPNATFRDYVRKFDKDGNGIFNQAELDAVTDIDVHGEKNIDDLKGIEHFANLSTLDCSETNITELDVSNNKILNSLSCYSTQLKTLNVNENEKLETLNCSNTNISTLNIQNNVNLAKLDCGYTLIADLDLKKNEKLTYLSINYTKIENLDISKQKLLQVLHLAGTKIRNLNIQHLQDLKELSISSTQIEELDLSKNTNLEGLFCSLSSLTGLDLSKNEKLNLLDTQYTPLTWINFGTSNNSSLQWHKNSPTIKMDTTTPYIDLKDYAGIDISKIDKDSITGGVLHESYLYYNKSGEAVSYMYDAGTVGGVAQELEVKFIPNEAGVNVDATNFPDPKFLAYVEKNIDNDGTGVLSQDEINAVLSIDLSNHDYTGITSVIGIEYFPSLTSLNLSGTKIPSLDLQKNTNLKDLQIDGMGLSHLYLGNNGDIKVNGGQSSATSVLQVTVDGSSFDITKVFPGIEIDRIHDLTGADLIGTTVQGYLPNTPITYSYKANDNENNPITLHVTLQLNVIKQDRTISFQKDFNKNKDYDGTEITISSNDIDMLGDKSLLSYTWEKLENNTWVDMNEAPVHAGVYRVMAHAEADDFYKEASSQPKEVIISQAQNEWTVTPSITEWTYGQYDANKNTPKAAAKFGQYDVTYKDAQGNIVTTTPQDAGAWTMVVSVPETEDYRGISKEVSFTIHKAQAPALVLPENLSAVHGDVLSSIVLPKGWSWVNGQETVSIRKLSYTARFAVDDKNYDYTNVPGYHANGGYVEHEIVLSISKATNAWLEAPSINEWTYGDTAIEPTGKAAFGNVEVSYSNAKDGTFTKDVPTEAGNWFVKLQVPTSAEYTGLEEILSFTIHKAPAPALVLPENLNTVHGDELSIITLPKGWAWVNGQEIVSVNKASYTARFTVDDKNYDYSTVPGYDATGHYVEILLPVIVSEYRNQWIEMPSIESWTYGEQPVQPTGIAVHGDVEVSYSDSVNGIFTKDVPTEAGNWFVKLQVPASTEYTGLEEILPFTIHKASAPALVLPENLSAVHGDELSIVTLPTGWTWINGQEKVSVHKASYTARFAVVDDKNYDYSKVPGYDVNGHYVEVELPVVVSKINNTWTETPSIDAWTYGETAKEPKVKAEYGDVKVSYSDSVNGTFTKDVPTEAGNWFVKLQVPASTEYTGLEEILPFTIHKASAPALVLPENISAVHGDILSNIVLPNGWTWVDGQEKVSVHKAGYVARFAVDDKNYDYSNVSGYNAGGHYVEVAIQLHVSQTNNTWTETPSMDDWTYGETAIEPKGKAAYGDVEVSYGDSINGTFTKDVPTEAGNWFVKLHVPASAEYTGLEEILPFTIHKAQALALVLPQNLSAIHGDTLSNIVLPKGWTWVDEKEKVSVYKTSYTARFAVDDKNYDYSNVTGYNATEHYVEIQLSVTISEYLNQWIEIPGIESWTYGEQPVQPAGKAAYGDVEVTYSNAKDGTFTKDVPTEAGDWFVKVQFLPAQSILV